VSESVLYGHDPYPNIVAVYPMDDDKMRVYVRNDNQVSFEDFPFYPFFYLSDTEYLKDFKRKHWIKELQGDNFYKFLVVFSSWFDMWECVHKVLVQYNKQPFPKATSFVDLPVIYLRPDPVSQFLLQTGKTLFKELGIEDIYRVHICFETYRKPGSKISHPERAEDRILLIGLTDNLGNIHIVGKKEQSEKHLLKDFIDLIHKLDPDTIEGNELHNFVIPYLMKRCEINELELTIGRDNSKPKTYELTSVRGDNPNEPPHYAITGRHLIDTGYLLQIYDPSKRITSELNLHTISEQLGYVGLTQFTSTPQLEISNDFETLAGICSNNLDRLHFITDLFLPVFFQQAKFFPYNLETLLRVSTNSKIESLLFRNYLKEKHSLPNPQRSQTSTGGHTQVFLRGVVGPVLYIDVESLYPTILIRDNLQPKSDRLGIFKMILSELTAKRLELKKQVKIVASKQIEILQNSFKLLINSFYGYLAYNRGIFNDYQQAHRVAETGQKVIKQIMESIHSKGGQVVEADTDGLFFIPPPFINTHEKQDNFVREINEDISKDFNLVIDGRYKKLMSYKKNNYATLDYDNKIKTKGSALISRNIERFGRNFINSCIECILDNNFEAMHSLYVNLYKDILTHNLQVQDFMRLETLKDSPERYQREVEAGDRNKSAGYELAVKSGIRWKVGKKIFYYVTGDESNVRAYDNCKFADEWDPNFPDENTGFYLKRLDEFTKKFEEFFSPNNFKLIFDNEADQLFPSNEIEVRISEVTDEHAVDEGAAKESEFGDYSIQLADD
jgi:DNA polymerase I